MLRLGTGQATYNYGIVGHRQSRNSRTTAVHVYGRLNLLSIGLHIYLMTKLTLTLILTDPNRAFN